MSAENCSDVFARLSEYLDRELAEADCAEMERHIAGCEPCVRFVESLRKSVELTHGFVTPEAPPPLSAQARDELRRAFERMRSGTPPRER